MAKNKRKEAARQAAAPAAAGSGLPAWLLPAGFAVWALVVLLNYKAQNFFFRLNPFDPPLWLANLNRAGALLQYLPHLGLLALLSLFALSAGGLLLRAAAGRDNKDIGALDWLLFSLGLGFGALSLLTLGLGAAGLLNSSALIALLVCGLAAGAARFRADLAAPLAALRAEARAIKFSGLDLVLLFVLFLLGASTLVLTLAPEIFFDSLVYHLGTPAFYINEGRLLAAPDNLHSASPLLMQMLYAAALLLSDDTLAKLLHFTAGAGLCGTLFAMGRRYAGVTAGLAACVIFLGMPMTGLNLGTTGVEVGAAWFSLLAAYALFLFTAREGAQAGPFDRTLLLAGVLAGLAGGTKYTSLFVVVAGLAVLLLRRPAEGGRGLPALKQALVFGTVAALVFSPWMVKNLVFHGNPLYPYFSGLFGGQTVDPFKWTVFNSDCFARDLRAAFGSLAGFWQFLSHPWRLTMSGAGNADFIGPFILLCAPLPFALRLEKPALRHLALFSAVMWALWALSTTMPRYLLPGLAVMSVLFAALLAGAAHKALRWLFLGLLVLSGLYGARWLSMFAESQEGWQVVFGLQRRADYLRSQHSSYPTPYYAAMEYINAELPPDSRVLFVGESRGYYCGRKFAASSVYDENPLVRAAGEAATPEELQARLRAAGITHIFLNLGEAMRVGETYRLFPWSERSLGVFSAWWDRHARQVWADLRSNSQEQRLLLVYKIEEAPGAGPAPFNYLRHIHLRSQKK